MKIRLIGDGDQVAATVTLLQTTPDLHVMSISRPYTNRRDPEQMRIYLDAEITNDRGPAGGVPASDHPVIMRTDAVGDMTVDHAAAVLLRTTGVDVTREHLLTDEALVHTAYRSAAHRWESLTPRSSTVVASIVQARDVLLAAIQGGEHR